MQVLTEECEGGSKNVELNKIGFRALVTTLSSESYKTEEVITSFQPEDFATDAANERYAELAMQTGQPSDFSVTEVQSELVAPAESVEQPEPQTSSIAVSVAFPQVSMTFMRILVQLPGFSAIVPVAL
jgi:hypothetical protein